jgi:hypothetical protein
MRQRLGAGFVMAALAFFAQGGDGQAQIYFPPAKEPDLKTAPSRPTLLCATVRPFMGAVTTEYKKIFRRMLPKDAPPSEAGAIKMLLSKSILSDQEILFLKIRLAAFAARFEFSRFRSLKNRSDALVLATLEKTLASFPTETDGNRQRAAFAIVSKAARYVFHTSMMAYFVWNVSPKIETLDHEIELLRIFSEKFDHLDDRISTGLPVYYGSFQEFRLALNFLILRQNAAFPHLDKKAIRTHALGIETAYKELVPYFDYALYPMRSAYMLGFAAYAHGRKTGGLRDLFVSLSSLMAALPHYCHPRFYPDLYLLYLNKLYADAADDSAGYAIYEFWMATHREKPEKWLLEYPNPLVALTFLSCLRKAARESGVKKIRLFYDQVKELPAARAFDGALAGATCKDLAISGSFP